MKQRILISMGAIVLGISTLTVGYAASKGREKGATCDRMMHEHMGNSMMYKNHMGTTGKGDGGMHGRHHPGMMGGEMLRACDEMTGSGIPRECGGMMRTHGMAGATGVAAPAQEHSSIPSR